MKPSRRLRVIDTLTRQTQLNLEKERQQLLQAAATRDKARQRYEQARREADATLAQLQRQTGGGQWLNPELVRIGASHAQEQLKSVVAAEQNLKTHEAEVARQRDAVLKTRMRLDKLDERRGDEVQQLAAAEQLGSQQAIDEAWLLRNGGIHHG